MERPYPLHGPDHPDDAGADSDIRSGDTSSADLSRENLDIYATKQGPWYPEYGGLDIPEDWELLPSGDAYVTRKVKAAGVYWICWQPRGRNRPHRRKIGIWAPAESIRKAQLEAERTVAKREKARANATSSTTKPADANDLSSGLGCGGAGSSPRSDCTIRLEGKGPPE